MNWFKNQTAFKKLIIGFSVVCAIMAGVGWVGVTRTGDVNRMLNRMYELELLGISRCKEVNVRLIAIRSEVRNVLLEEQLADKQIAAAAMESRAAEFVTLLESCKLNFLTAEGIALLKRIDAAFPEYMQDARACVELSMQGKQDEALGFMRSGRSKSERLDTDLSELSLLKEKIAEQAYEESDVVYENARWTILMVTSIGVIVGLVVGTFISRLFSVPLQLTVETLKAVAQGDFTARLNVTTKDEIGTMAMNLNEALGNIQSALLETQTVADSVASAAQQLSSASEEISSGAQEQASGLEETAASLEEITSTVRQNADNAQQANQLASNARETAEKGGKIVSDAVHGMTEINGASRKIADIITTIDEIAFQTNLLALNAAVEAARAGEQGRGFAVVAGEVRNLAQRSAAAAKEIKGLINDSVQKVDVGSSLVNQSGDALEGIVQSVKRVTDIVSEIAAASREQTRGIDQVNKAVSQMDTVTQANASQTEELSGTAESLSAQAERLQNLISRFKLHDQGNDSAGRPRSPQSHSRPTAQPKKSSVAKSAVTRKSPRVSTEARDDFSFDDRRESELVTSGSTSSTHGGFEEF